MTEQFLPGNPAAFNARALQRLCDKGGRIVIDVPGVYELDRTIFLSSHTAVDCVRLINSDIGSSRILLKERPYPELSYPEAKILLSGTTFSGGEAELLRCTEKRSAALCIQGSLSLDDAPRKIAGKVRVISSDLSLETIE